MEENTSILNNQNNLIPYETYGSIHNHFESQYDTANGDFKTMLRSYAACGMKRVVVTDHGVFTAFEDVLETLHQLKKEGECPDLEILPGVEAYFSVEDVSNISPLEASDKKPEASHLLLFAKDYEGYQSLCKIMTQSSLDYTDGKPIVTLTNLQKNVKKGHVYCTSACIAGIFGTRLGLNRISLEEKIAYQMNKLTEQPLDTQLLIEKDVLRQEPCFKPLLSVNYAKKDMPPLLVRDLLKKKAKTPAEELLLQYHVTKANFAIREYLRKEKNPKPHNGQVHPLALQYFEERKAFYEHSDCASYQEKKPKTVLFSSLQRMVEQLNALPSKKKVKADCKKLYQAMQRIFGRDFFYFELQYHGLKQEKALYTALVDFAEEMGNTDHFIASNDVHIGISKAYAKEQGLDWESFLSREVIKRDMICFTRFNSFRNEDDTISDDSYEYYIKSDFELKKELEKIIPNEAVLTNAFSNIKAVLSGCQVIFPENENHYPVFSENQDELFLQKVQEGIKRRFPNGFPNPSVYEQRIKMETETMSSMGYIAYHLIVADYLEYGRKLGYLPQRIIDSAECPLTLEELDAYIETHSIPVNAYAIGPGRGSAAGSEVCFLLGITDIDPIPYGLLFERYLNQERSSMPDIDADFSGSVRERSIEYVKRKYGWQSVCAILTKSYAGVKNAIKIAGRYTGAKVALRYESKETKENIEKEYYNLSDILCKAYDKYEEKNGVSFFDHKCTDKEREVLQYAKLIVNCFTGYGQHAAGVIISGDIISDSMPLAHTESIEVISLATQCNMAQAEAKGYLKMDFLGLSNLDILTAIARRTNDYSFLDYEKRMEILADKAIYKRIYSTGLTQGVFQFESKGMKTILQRFEPDCFEDIILLVSLYRPGPMQFIDEVIAEKQYRKAQADAENTMEQGAIPCPDGSVLTKPVHSIQIENAVLKEILEPTYGCIIYQEQIMHICQRIAGYTMGQADNVRRYMSKKKDEKLKGERPAFVRGCITTSGLTEGEANDLFDRMIDFAKYAFNKSHACCYAVISVLTAYCKLYHPAEFFTESFNAISKLSELLNFTIEIPAFQLELIPPDLLYSENEFTCIGNKIYYGLSAIKGLTEVDFVPTKDFLSFVITNREQIKEKTMIKLCKCGLFDSMEKSISRMDLCEAIPKLYQSLKAIDSLQDKLKKAEEQLQFLSGYQKERLTITEKAELAEYFAMRKSLDKISAKDVIRKRETIENHQKQYRCELIETEDKLENILRVLRITSKHTTESILFDRKWEQELLGYVFHIEESIAVLENCNTFPDGVIDCRRRVEQDIPNLGLIVLNPCVKVTPGGWVKVLCCDKNRTYKNLYFKDYFPEDVAEFAITFKEERLQEQRESRDGKPNSNNMYVAPYAYSVTDMGFQPNTHIYVEYRQDWEAIIRKLNLTTPFYPTAYFHCYALDNFHIPCKAEELRDILKMEEVEYVEYVE